MIHICGFTTQSSITGVQDGDVQPNAIDLRLGKVLKIDDSVTFVISDTQKGHRGSTTVEPNSDGWYDLGPGTYEVVMENVVKIGAGEAGFVITRSTLNRNGVFLTSGLYDSGYHGKMAAAMHVRVGPMRIKQGTRIGQFLLFKAEALHAYDGDYGLNKDHDRKYD